MKKQYSVLIIAALILLTGTDCFAQSLDIRVEALQGEWQCVMLNNGDEVIDFTKAPYAEYMDNVWKFEGNNFFSVVRNLHDGTSEVVTATFTIVGESLVLSSDGISDAYSYTLENDILTTIGHGFIFVLLRRW